MRFLIGIVFGCIILFGRGAWADSCKPDLNEVGKRIATYYRAVLYITGGTKAQPVTVGTASLIDDRGYFITALHSVSGLIDGDPPKPIHLKSPHYAYYFDAIIVGRMPSLDVAILKVDSKDWSDKGKIADGPIPMRFVKEPYAVTSFYVGYGLEKTSPNSMPYSISKFDPTRSKNIFVLGAPLGGDSGSLLLDPYGYAIGVNIAQTHPKAHESTTARLSLSDQVQQRAMTAVSLDHVKSSQLFNSIPLSETAQLYLNAIRNKEAKKTMDKILDQSNEISQFEAYKIISAFPAIKNRDPEAIEHYFNSGSNIEFLELAMKLCIQAPLNQYFFEVLSAQNTRATLGVGNQILDSIKDEYLIESIDKVGMLDGMTPEYERGLAKALELRFNERVTDVLNSYGTRPMQPDVFESQQRLVELSLAIESMANANVLSERESIERVVSVSQDFSDFRNDNPWVGVYEQVRNNEFELAGIKTSDGWEGALTDSDLSTVRNKFDSTWLSDSQHLPGVVLSKELVARRTSVTAGLEVTIPPAERIEFTGEDPLELWQYILNPSSPGTEYEGLQDFLNPSSPGIEYEGWQDILNPSSPGIEYEGWQDFLNPGSPGTEILNGIDLNREDVFSQ